jgi:hypothetical protein
VQKRGEVPLAREQRKLAAIVAADVVGYSSLMGRDESGTLALWSATGRNAKQAVFAGFSHILGNVLGNQRLQNHLWPPDFRGARSRQATSV